MMNEEITRILISQLLNSEARSLNPKGFVYSDNDLTFFIGRKVAGYVYKMIVEYDKGHDSYNLQIIRFLDGDKYLDNPDWGVPFEGEEIDDIGSENLGSAIVRMYRDAPKYQNWKKVAGWG